MCSLMKTQFFWFCLLICYVCVTQVSGSLPNGCEINIRKEYQNYTPKTCFLHSFMHHSLTIFQLMPIANFDAENYFAALYESVSNVIGTLAILSPRGYCQVQYSEREYYTCIEAISYFRVHNISDIELHANIPGRDMFRFMYFDTVIEHIRTRDSEKQAIIRNYYSYLYGIAQELDYYLFPTISNFCHNPGDFEELFNVDEEE